MAPTLYEFDGRCADIAAEWRELAVARGSYFQSPAWVASWWQHLAGRPPTTVAAWRGADHRLEAVAFVSQIDERLHPAIPLTVSLTVNAGGGIGAGDHLGFPSVPSRRADVVRWVAALPGAVRLDSLAGDQLDLIGQDAGWVHTGSTETFERPIVPGAELFSSKSVTKDFRRRERRLEQAGVEVEVLAGLGIGDDVVDGLFDLHDERFAELGEASVFGRERRPQLLELVAASTADCYPMAVVARSEGSIVGVDWSFVCGTRLHNYQGGWSQRYRREGLGLLLVLRAIVWARDAGVETFDFLRGSAEFKERFDARPRRDRSYVRPRGAAGRALQVKSSVRSKLRR